MRANVHILFVILAAGCASAPPPETLPLPSNFEISGTAEIHLPPPITLQWGIPTSLKAALHAAAHSEAISASPLRSHHEGHMTLVVTDGLGKQTFVNIDIAVSGDSDGTPTDGLGQVISRFCDSASLMTRPVPQIANPSH